MRLAAVAGICQDNIIKYTTIKVFYINKNETLIVATAVFACACAAPSALLSNGILAYGAYPVASVNSGDLQAAAIDTNVAITDHARAAVDAVQEINDQAAEIHGKAINAAEDNAWQAVNAAQVAAAQVDGAVASVSPDAARHAVAPVAYSVPAVSYAASLSPALSAYSAPFIGARSIALQGYAHNPAFAYAARGLVYA
ncbi:unnamed protein product, partial [Brenthis ino]